MGPEPRPILDRFWEKVERGDKASCWNWQASLRTDGYGRLYVKTNGKPKMVMAHRVSYQLFRGEIPDGLDLDHLCRNRACVNPEHLEICTRRENVLRGIGFPAINFRKTACPQGHFYDDQNTWRDKHGYRHCRQCHRDRAREQSRLRPRKTSRRVRNG